ncbi:MAG: GatB/YqeY domain-containing protein [Patescibacteria group bacterium]
MTTLERIDADLKEAMKAKDEAALSALRLVRSALKNKQIDVQHELSEDDVVAVIRTMAKQYRDALADFSASGRQDLVDKQTAEIMLLEKYLPAAMPEAELTTICERIIKEQNATVKDMGKIMGLVMKEVGGRADGTTVRTIVQKLLNI